MSHFCTALLCSSHSYFMVMEYVGKDDIQWGETDIAILSKTDINNLIQFKNLASPNEDLFLE